MAAGNTMLVETIAADRSPGTVEEILRKA